MILVLAADAGHRLGQVLGAEAGGLQEGALGKLCSADSIREAEVVLDFRAASSLASGRLGLDEQGAQPL